MPEKNILNDKPFSQACENNKAPILQVISKVFNRPMTEYGKLAAEQASMPVILPSRCPM
jgi:hypothetical protein